MRWWGGWVSGRADGLVGGRAGVSHPSEKHAEKHAVIDIVNTHPTYTPTHLPTRGDDTRPVSVSGGGGGGGSGSGTNGAAAVATASSSAADSTGGDEQAKAKKSRTDWSRHKLQTFPVNKNEEGGWDEAVDKAKQYIMNIPNSRFVYKSGGKAHGMPTALSKCTCRRGENYIVKRANYIV